MLDRYPRVMSRAVLSWVVEQLDAGERVAMASVIEALGSGPGKPGAKLAVSTSGKKFGTCLLYTYPSPRDKRQSRIPSCA